MGRFDPKLYRGEGRLNLRAIYLETHIKPEETTDSLNCHRNAGFHGISSSKRNIHRTQRTGNIWEKAAKSHTVHCMIWDFLVLFTEIGGHPDAYPPVARPGSFDGQSRY